MFNPGLQELLLILAVVLVVVGPKRLPEIANSIGRLVGAMRRASEGFYKLAHNAERNIDHKALLDSAETEKPGPKEKPSPQDSGQNNTT